MRKRTYAGRVQKPATKKAKLYRSPKYLLGNQVTTTLKYVGFSTLNPGAAGIPASHVYSANGAYDPDITGTGHQPRGFDQLMALYDHYFVVRSKIILTVLAPRSNESNIVGIILQDDATPESNMNQALENRHTVSRGLSYGNGSVKMSLPFESKSYFALKDRDLFGTVGANPADQAYYIVFCQPCNPVDNNNVDYMVEIEYTIQFNEPNNVAPS